MGWWVPVLDNLGMMRGMGKGEHRLLGVRGRTWFTPTPTPNNFGRRPKRLGQRPTRGLRKVQCMLNGLDQKLNMVSRVVFSFTCNTCSLLNRSSLDLNDCINISFN